MSELMDREQEPGGVVDEAPTRLPALLLVLAVLACYGAILGYPFVFWDDHHFILANPGVIAPESRGLAELLLTPEMGYPVPVTLTTQALLYAIGGGAAIVFHAFALGVHAASALLLAGILQRVTARPAFSAALAAVWALHPMTVEIVAWATGLKDGLAILFSLLAIRAFLDAPVRERRGIVIAVMAGLACFSKANTVLLGAALLATLASMRASGAPLERSAARGTAVAFVMGLLVAALGLLVRSDSGVDDPAILEGSFQSLVALGHQVQHLVWPSGLHHVYDIDRARGFADPHAWVGLGVVIAVGAALALARRTPAVVLGLSVAVATYLPVSNIIPFNRFIADSYMALPLIGVLIAVAAFVAERVPEETAPLRLAGPAALVAALLIAPTLSQVQRWSSSEALWRPVVQENPDWIWARLQLAAGLRRDGKPSEAADTLATLFDGERYYGEQLEHLAKALLEAERFEEAECVLVEDLHYGSSRERALHNLALLSVLHEPVRYPEAHAMAVRHAVRLHEGGALGWPAPLITRLEARAAALSTGTPRPLPPWPRRGCAILKGG